LIAAAIQELSDAFEKISDEDLVREYPLPIADQRLRTSDFMIHLAVHLAYHLGQIDYHRRLLTSSAASVNTVSPRELDSIVP
jgi:uncharacterized damage-inducible protein DinB